MPYYKINSKEWNRYHSDPTLKYIDYNKVYQCFPILESSDTILRMLLDEETGYCIYIPVSIVIPIEKIREENINIIINED